MKQFLKAVPQLIVTPLVVIGVVAMVLYLIGLVPDYVHGYKNGLKEYGSIEEAQADIGFRLVLPSYFPSYLSWPPDRVYGRREPVPVIQALFLSQYGYAEVMIISQIESKSPDLPVSLPWIETIEEQSSIALGDHTGVMITGSRADGQLLNGAYWRSGDFYFVVITTHSARELLTIVRSM